tara:strand:+ start:88 stop:852 length:765 start_codon:yes stop_codon:yes gene_type:complete
MLEEPYRWVEAVRNRRDYLEDQLQNATPVVGLTYDKGILLLTSTPGPRKLFEIYNQVGFAAIGHPADIEKLRKAVIDIAHVEAFNFSASDISLQRLVSFGVGPLIKAAFDEIFRSPYTARGLMVELDPPVDQDPFYMIDADGSFTSARHAASVAGTREGSSAIMKRLEVLDGTELSLQEGLHQALGAWGIGVLAAKGEEGLEPDESVLSNFLARELPDLRIEAAVLDRTLSTKTKFRLLEPADLTEVLKTYSAA